MRLIFEIRDLAFASPATVTRAGVLFISDEDQWKNFVESWIQEREANEPPTCAEVRKARADKLRELFDKYMPPTMLEIKKNFPTLVPILDFNMAQTLLLLPRGLLSTENVGNKDANAFEIYFVLACVWACGSAMSITSGVDVRKEFSKWWKDTWKTVKFPHRGEVWDYYVDKKKQEFVPWAESVPTIAYDSTAPMSMVTVPTGETASINYWVDNLLARSHGAMLLGSAGVGKTAIIMGKLRSLREEYTFTVINVNYYTNFLSLMKQLEGPLEKKAGKNFGPPGNKKLIYFVDDLNMAALDKYNTATNISLMRQHMGYGHIYDLNKLTQKVLMNTQYLSAHEPDRRLVRHQPAPAAPLCRLRHRLPVGRLAQHHLLDLPGRPPQELLVGGGRPRQEGRAGRADAAQVGRAAPSARPPSTSTTSSTSGTWRASSRAC